MYDFIHTKIYKLQYINSCKTSEQTEDITAAAGAEMLAHT